MLLPSWLINSLVLIVALIVVYGLVQLMFNVVRGLRNSVIRALDIIESRRSALQSLTKDFSAAGHPVIRKIEDYLAGIRGLERKYAFRPGLVRRIGYVFRVSFMVLIVLALLHTLLYILLTPIQNIIPQTLAPVLSIARGVLAGTSMVLYIVLIVYIIAVYVIAVYYVAYKSVAYEFLRLIEEFIELIASRAKIAITQYMQDKSIDGIHVGFLLAQGLYEDFYSVHHSGLHEVRSILSRSLPRALLLGGVALSLLLFMMISGLTTPIGTGGLVQPYQTLVWTIVVFVITTASMLTLVRYPAFLTHLIKDTFTRFIHDMKEDVRGQVNQFVTERLLCKTCSEDKLDIITIIMLLNTTTTYLQALETELKEIENEVETTIPRVRLASLAGPAAYIISFILKTLGLLPIR
ncbi:hypothetical protein J4526_07790 [Desulfurococcaceae archaeon MEX13E-LK6-19]|nr:hypothetical protein J4526_07790 [Desulfurococcaceae archaeon MEX13E-LK6-19]